MDIRDYNKTNICIIASSPSLLGGQSVQASEICQRFKSEGYNIDYLPVNPSLRGIWGVCQNYKYLRTIVTLFAYLKNLVRNIRKYDVLHIFSASYFSFLLAPTPAIILGKYFNKRIILNYHSGEAYDHLYRASFCVKKIMALADVIVVPSKYLHEVFQKYNLDSRIIHNVVNQDQFPFWNRTRFRPSFIVVRNLEPIYNIPCVLKAFGIIQREFSEAKLTVIGYGSEESRLKSLSRELGLMNVHFVGRVDRDDISQYYRKADFMLNTSNIDNMPVSILEAFSSGIPVISTKAGGIPYIIRDGENGMLTPLNDENTMAQKVLYLLENQDLARRIAEKANEDSRKYYSWDKIRENWLKVYLP